MMTESNNKEITMSKIVPNEVPRENLIDTAVKFLLNPRVFQSSVSHKSYFLKKKGLTDQEIDIALEQSLTNRNRSPGTQPVMTIDVSDNDSLWSKLRSFSTTSILIGTSLYFLYKFYRKFIFPHIFGSSKKETAFSKLTEVVNSLDKSIKVLESSMTSFNCKLEQYFYKLDSISDSSNLNKNAPEELKSLKQEISSLKGLLLNRKQFPPAPSVSPVIPAWQQTSNTKDLKNVGDYSRTSGDSDGSNLKSFEENLRSKSVESNAKYPDNISSDNDNGSYVCVDELSEEN